MSVCVKYGYIINKNLVLPNIHCLCAHNIKQNVYISRIRSLTSQSKSKTKEVDPIIEKYRKYISQISTKSPTEDVSYITNFGSIRFDSDNLVLEEPQDNPLAKKPERQGNLKKNENLNYIDNIYFRESLSDIDSSKYTKIENAPTQPYTKKQEFSPPTDLNDIDAQYIVTKCSNDSVKQRESSQVALSYTKNGYDEEYESRPMDEIEVFPQVHINTQIFSFEDSLLEADTVSYDSSLCFSESNNSRPNYSDVKEQFIHLSEKVTKMFPDRKLRMKHIKKKEIVTPQEKETKAVETPITKVESPTSTKSDSFISSSMSAYDYVKNERKEKHIASIKQIKGEILPHEKYKNILIQLPRFSHFTLEEMAYFLKKSVIYNKDDVVALFKPYGIPVHGGGKSKQERYNIHDLLPHLSEALKEENLQMVHRIDMQTTGILLLAKSDVMADKLKSMFKKQQIRKTYLAITKNAPTLMNGVIDIPISEGAVDGYQRMVLRPDIDGFRARQGQSKKAITRFKVLSRTNATSLLEVTPITGIKHQIRVHLGFGLNCPILGDHKYSYLTKMAPQKLPGDALEMLGLKQSAVRHLPIHLHAFRLGIPGARKDGGEISIKVGPPKFFKTTLKALKLSNRNNRLTEEYSDVIFGY